jgi:solute carrier family 24 (sodium/potassium/calcium exchanger), member 6
VLFSTIGIAASDFLCINLSTLASILGMSESLTGVTFLAFGNGSPDVFSTFAAMNSNSGSLAVGELIGAACFITAVVAGSMALVRPFRVARRSFIRDVGYFVVAGSFGMVFLADGELHVWECISMVGLYLFYVVMVVSWHWYRTRQRRKHERDLAARSQFHIPQNQELDLQVPVDEDDPVPGESRSLLHGPSVADFDALEQQTGWSAWKDDEDDETGNQYLAEIRENMHVNRQSMGRRRTTLNPIRPSLVGALEFRSVLSSLQQLKNIHNGPINLRRYSDVEAARSRSRDSISILSNPLENTGNFINTQPGAARVRSVSLNDVGTVRLDGNVDGRRQEAVHATEPSENCHSGLSPSPQFVPFDSSALLTVSPISSTFSSRDQSPAPNAPSSDYLTVPMNDHRNPEHQSVASPRTRSPGGSLLPTAQIPRISISPDYSVGSPLLPFPALPDSPVSASSKVPSILLPPPIDCPTEDVHFTRPLRWWPYSLLPPPWLVVSTLFPTLCDWKTKGILEKFLAVAAAPSVFLLTVTVPVMGPYQPDPASNLDPTEPPHLENGDIHNQPRIQLTVDSPRLSAADAGPTDRELGLDESDPSSPAVTRRRRSDSETPVMHSPDTRPLSGTKEWNQWLVSVQLFGAPFFIALTVGVSMDANTQSSHLLVLIMSCLLFSLICVLIFNLSMKGKSYSQPPYKLRLFLALLGFLVGICWVATIANEVVSVLKSLGVIFNISDSLLGLTIFAVGNSMGDLVANITIARLGYPNMALSACFGGPMLNILLGIGVGGLYMTLKSKPPLTSASLAHPYYQIAISKTLAISGATLLVTLIGLLIIVPLNGWWMDRKVGWGLVLLWTLSTLGNVIAEVST